MHANCGVKVVLSVSSGTSLHLFLHRTEEDGLPAGAQLTDRRPVLVSRPDGSRSFLHPSFGRHWNHVPRPGGQPPFTQLVRKKDHSICKITSTCIL